MVDGKRYAHFNPLGDDFDTRVDFIIDNWIPGAGIDIDKSDVILIYKTLDDWFFYRISNQKKLQELGRVYLSQMDTINEIIERFKSERVHMH